MSANYPMGKMADTIINLGSDWFDSEHGNGGHWGWMKFINKFKLPQTTDPYVFYNK